MDRSISVEPFLPGEYIKEEMESREWTQDDLASVLGVTRQTVNRLLSGKSGVTPEMAHLLGAAFGTSANMWMNLQTSYELSKSEHDTKEIERRSAIFDQFPISALVKRKWIAKTKSCDELEKSLSSFLERDCLDSPSRFRVAARKSTGGKDGPQLAWFARVRKLSVVAPASKYKDGIDDCLSDLSHLLHDPKDVAVVPKVLSDHGIRLVVVKHLPKTKIDGVATWVKGEPVVGLSLRYGRIDNFWFTLLHELTHIKYRDEAPVDTEEMFKTDEESNIEIRANDEAASFLVPREKLDSFILRAGPLYYQRRVIQFANANGIHPGIVVGQLQRRGELDYSQLRKLLAPIRDRVIGKAITDGWGNNIQL
ncbi:putative HTH-type transcriptional regulator YddM [Symmachiella macrocystis]|uniref:Putative HTH-type transcriptional regulator YddM n=1 Tax=Symmachiella macrocystis TaxID=2527985 RepID=A0A5C6BR68_9PLAN|nr:HigA family addiction module antitoxin [Symmachiella macrocystis]TWU13164.1 putative HTH-type transcriptional regulator YddM [Symmachiella macrocystis]